MKTATVNQDTNTVTIDGVEYEIGKKVEPKIWKPAENGNGFWFIDSSNIPQFCNNLHWEDCQNVIAVGNYYKTKEEAVNAVGAKFVVERVSRFIREENQKAGYDIGGCVPGYVRHLALNYDGTVCIMSGKFQAYPTKKAMGNREIAQKVLDRFSEDELRVFITEDFDSE